MESESLDAQRRRPVFFTLFGVAVLLAVSFSIVNYIGANVLAMWTDIVIASVVAGAVLACLLGIEDRRVYRFVLGGVGIGLWCLAALGSSLLYYHAVLPLLACFFLGRREGMIGSVVFLFGMTVLMMAPGLVGSHVYETGNSLRFLVAYLFLTLVGWSYERSRERVQGLLATKNGQLQLEKERLKDALVQVRTLRGLLPMCASCKRIRDDDGRWERIDTYVSQRSEAHFTHGICPDCSRTLYSDIA